MSISIKIKKNTSEQILKHRNAKALFVYLELKPKFTNSIFFPEAGKFPYRILAVQLNISESNLRSKINTLVKLNLCQKNTDKSISFAPYRFFYEQIIKCTYRRGKQWHIEQLPNETKLSIQKLVICENIKKQEYMIFQKILKYEVCHALERSPNISTARFFEITDKKIIKHYRKKIRESLKFYLDKWQTVYNKTIAKESENNYKDFETKKFSRCFVNPETIISYKRMSELFNITSGAGAKNIMDKLINKGYFERYTGIMELDPKCHKVREDFNTLQDAGMFGMDFKHYVTQRFTQKFFINLPNAYKISDNNICNEVNHKFKKLNKSKADFKNTFGLDLFKQFEKLGLL